LLHKKENTNSVYMDDIIILIRDVDEQIIFY